MPLFSARQPEKPANTAPEPFFKPTVQLQTAKEMESATATAKTALQQATAALTLYQILNEGKIKSPTFASLMKQNKINRGNYEDIIHFGSETETNLDTGKISLVSGNDIKFQIIQLTHELTNRLHLKELQKVSAQMEKGIITAQTYAKSWRQWKPTVRSTKSKSLPKSATHTAAKGRKA